MRLEPFPRCSAAVVLVLLVAAIQVDYIIIKNVRIVKNNKNTHTRGPRHCVVLNYIGADGEEKNLWPKQQ